MAKLTLNISELHLGRRRFCLLPQHPVVLVQRLWFDTFRASPPSFHCPPALANSPERVDGAALNRLAASCTVIAGSESRALAAARSLSVRGQAAGRSPGPPGRQPPVASQGLKRRREGRRRRRSPEGQWTRRCRAEGRSRQPSFRRFMILCVMACRLTSYFFANRLISDSSSTSMSHSKSSAITRS